MTAKRAISSRPPRSSSSGGTRKSSRRWRALPPKMSPAPGGIHRGDLGGGQGTAPPPVLEVAAPGTQGDHGQGDAALLQQAAGPLLGGAAPEEVHLLIAELDHIRLTQAPQDLGPGLRRGGPEGETQVGIKGDGPAQLPGVGHRGRVADRAGSSVRLREPKWKRRQRWMRERSTSSHRSWVSAPGLRAKLKERSPAASRVTKARVVKAEEVRRMPRVWTPARRRDSRRRRPKASSPTLPRKAVRRPYLLRAARRLPGAPRDWP